jgi:adenylate kinase family enzyme
MKRIVIIGNSGSGKSFLAGAISSKTEMPVIHLDKLFWVSGGFNEKRPVEVVHAEIESKKKEDEWIVEGVFGELAERFLDRADYLIWLDLSWPTCRNGLLARGSESSKQLDPVKAEENFQNLLTWAENYWNRTNPRSHFGHQKIFDGYQGTKERITDRESIEEFLKRPNKALHLTPARVTPPAGRYARVQESRHGQA